MAGAGERPPGEDKGTQPEIPALVKVKIDGLCKHYGNVTALQPTFIEMQAGEFLTLLGPSGSGKTTLLQMVCGLAVPDGGRVFIDGRDMTNVPVRERGLGLVFQNYALFPHMTVAENIGFPLEMRGLGRGERRKLVRHVAEMVKLDTLLERLPSELSGGQQQRVALARCFVYQPSIILMDEPLGALDKKLREHMQLEIRRLHRETGATIIYVTHDQEEALTISDRICLMNHARVEQIDTPQRIYSRPSSVFAAEFVGLSNILPGVVTKAPDGTSEVETAYGRFRTIEALPSLGAKVHLLLRPEHLCLGARFENAVTGRIAEIIYAGSEIRLIVGLGGGTDLMVRIAADSEDHAIGQSLTVSWPASCGVVLA